MACSRGKASPTQTTQLRLFADSGGFCQNPRCLHPLFLDTEAGAVHVAEMAHIVAAKDGGPRADPALSAEERGAYGNLILLCPTCHSTIDKAPDAFPDTMVLDWKCGHRRRIDEAFGAREYADRSEVRKAVEPLLAENETIFSCWGPDLPYRFDPESEFAEVWRRKVRSRILPNNRKILAVIDANKRHLTDVEASVLERFRQHVDDLESRHLGDGAARLPGTTFPEEMNTILAGA